MQQHNGQASAAKKAPALKKAGSIPPADDTAATLATPVNTPVSSQPLAEDNSNPSANNNPPAGDACCQPDTPPATENTVSDSSCPAADENISEDAAQPVEAEPPAILTNSTVTHSPVSPDNDSNFDEVDTPAPETPSAAIPGANTLLQGNIAAGRIENEEPNTSTANNAVPPPNQLEGKSKSPSPDKLDYRPLTIGENLVTVTVGLLPFMGLLACLLWSWGGSTRFARQNLAKALLWLHGIALCLLVLGLLIWVFTLAGLLLR